MSKAKESVEREQAPVAIPLTLSALSKDRVRRQNKQELICHSHDKIQDAAERIAYLDFQNARISEIEDLQNQMVELADYIVELVGYAKERGQAMEDRLSAYNAAIQDLGFTRRRK